MLRESVRAASREGNTREVLVARSARPEDAEQISLLSAPFVEDGLLIARPPEELAEKLHEFLVASQGDRLVGCAGTAPAGRSLVVYNLCIAAEWQGRGIGRRLIEGAASTGRERGYHSLLAVSRYGGEWFETLGFSKIPVSEIRDEWRTLFRPGRRSSLYQLRLTAD